MTVSTVELTGKGATGLLPQAKLKGIAQGVLKLPTTVRLGKLPAEVPEGLPRFAHFFHPAANWKAPETCDYSDKAAASLMTMLGNDSHGDCVIAGKLHAIGVWTANDSDSGGEVVPTKDEALRQYERICGPGDNGCVITRVLDVFQSGGLDAGGQKHKLGGYVAVDWTKQDRVKAATFLFGAVTIGFNFPSAWSGTDTWAPTNSRVVGGHDVTIIRYDQRGVYVSSWGRVYLMTWAALAQQGRVDECYALLSPDWTGNDKLSPAGVDVDGLQQALEAFARGDDPDPQPPAPPPPPPPAPPPAPMLWPTYTLSGRVSADYGTFHGTLTPQAPDTADDPDGITEFDCHDERVAATVADAVLTPAGCTFELQGSVISVTRGRLSPEQWKAIIQLVLQIVAVLGPIIGG